MENFEIKTRKVKQQYRKYSETFKRKVVSEVLNRGTEKKIDVLRRNGVENYSLYYKWERKYKRFFRSLPVERVPMTKEEEFSNVIRITEIRIKVDIRDINEVIRVVDEIKQVVGVKSVMV